MTEQLQLGLEFGDEPTTPQQMVEHFHWRFLCPVDQREYEVVKTRHALIKEEFHELQAEITAAMANLACGDPIESRVLGKIAKESADLLYVVYGTAVALGIDLEEAFRRVHQSNMSKLGVDNRPIFRDDGKVLKGPNYFEPDMSGTYREERDEQASE